MCCLSDGVSLEGARTGGREAQEERTARAHRQGVPGSACIFPARIMGLAFSLKNPGLFWWRMVSRKQDLGGWCASCLSGARRRPLAEGSARSELGQDWDLGSGAGGAAGGGHMTWWWGRVRQRSWGRGLGRRLGSGAAAPLFHAAS